MVNIPNIRTRLTSLKRAEIKARADIGYIEQQIAAEESILAAAEQQAVANGETSGKKLTPLEIAKLAIKAGYFVTNGMHNTDGGLRPATMQAVAGAYASWRRDRGEPVN